MQRSKMSDSNHPCQTQYIYTYRMFIKIKLFSKCHNKIILLSNSHYYFLPFLIWTACNKLYIDSSIYKTTLTSVHFQADDNTWFSSVYEAHSVFHSTLNWFNINDLCLKRPCCFVSAYILFSNLFILYSSQKNNDSVQFKGYLKLKDTQQ